VTDVVLVTGAGGFVGSAIMRAMVARLTAAAVPLHGMTVRRVLGLLRPGEDRWRLSDLQPTDVWSVHEIDLGEPDAVASFLRSHRPVAIIHAALDGAVFNTSSRSEAERLICGPTATLIRELAATGGARFIQTSTVWVLPAGASLDEESPLAPASPYAWAKAREEELVRDLAATLAIEWITLRLFNIVGRYERPDRLIPYLVSRLQAGEVAELSRANNVRDFTDVDVIATAFVRALEAPSEATGALYHIGTGRGISVGRVAEIVADRVGSPRLLRFGRQTPDAAVDTQVANITRARTRLGWTPAGDIETWVRNAADWWLARAAA
jgi:UDP-glucose 4-epimerase